MPKKPNKKKPISEKQLAANRANARKSRGPKTPYNRAEAARRRDGEQFETDRLFAAFVDLPDRVADRRARLAIELQPVGEQEHLLVDQIALCYTRFDHLAYVESGLFLNYKLGLGFHAMSEATTLTTFLRYQGQAERLLRRLNEELRTLQEIRRAAERDYDPVQDPNQSGKGSNEPARIQTTPRGATVRSRVI